MDISRLVRGLLGFAEPPEPRLVELKIGQVVRGVVMQLLSEQEAVVQIGGMPVRARLDAPLAVGQPTLLQVQPESSGGQIVMKPLTASEAPLPDSSLGDLARLHALKDTETNRALLREMHRFGIPLDKRTISAFRAMNEAMPAGLQRDVWLASAGIAFKQGLPLKAEVVLSLHQALFGEPLEQKLETLNSRLQAFIGSAANSGAGQGAPSAGGAAALATRLAALIERIPAWLPAAANDSLSRPASASISAHTSTQPERQAADLSSGLTARGGQQASAAQSSPAAPMQAAVNAPSDSAAQPAGPGVTFSSRLQGEGAAASLPASDRPANPAPGAEPPSASAARTDSNIAERSEQRTANAMMRELPASDRPANPASGAENEPLRRLLRLFGLDYENVMAKQLGRSAPDPEQTEAVKQSVKGLVLELLRHDSLPAPLRESLQHTLQHLTGQQLLLGGERTDAMAVLTLVVPLGDPGEQTSCTMQIQSRRNSRGQVDADNCRLLFDLNMKQLGDLLIDVQVSSRIVALHVRSNHPAAASLLDAARPELNAALSGIGYSLLSLKHSPYAAAGESRGDADAAGAEKPIAVSGLIDTINYRGFDLRV